MCLKADKKCHQEYWKKLLMWLLENADENESRLNDGVPNANQVKSNPFSLKTCCTYCIQ